MNRRTIAHSLISLAVLLAAAASHALDVPRLQGRVNDYADMIPSGVKSQMEEKLKALEQSDSTQIFVLTVPSLEGQNIEELAIRVFDVWKAGQKGKDNGVLFIVAKKERKIRIEVGRGLEGKLTDLAAGRIIDNVIKPKFKGEDFAGGFVDGVDALVAATKGEFNAGGSSGRKKESSAVHVEGVCSFLGGVVVMIVVMAVLVRRKRGGNFKKLDETARSKILEEESKTGWGTALGLGAVALPMIGYATLVVEGAQGKFERLSLVGILICAAIGLVMGLIIKATSLGGRSGGAGSGSSGWSSSDSSSGGWSDSSSDSGGSDSGGGGGESGGGGASGDY